MNIKKGTKNRLGLLIRALKNGNRDITDLILSIEIKNGRGMDFKLMN